MPKTKYLNLWMVITIYISCEHSEINIFKTQKSPQNVSYHEPIGIKLSTCIKMQAAIEVTVFMFVLETWSKFEFKM